MTRPSGALGVKALRTEAQARGRLWMSGLVGLRAAKAHEPCPFLT